LSTFHRLSTVHYDLSTAGTRLASLKFINEARLTVIVDMGMCMLKHSLEWDWDKWDK